MGVMIVVLRRWDLFEIFLLISFCDLMGGCEQGLWRFLWAKLSRAAFSVDRITIVLFFVEKLKLEEFSDGN